MTVILFNIGILYLIMKKIKKSIIVLIIGSIIIYLSGCASITYNPYNKDERIKVILK